MARDERAAQSNRQRPPKLSLKPACLNGMRRAQVGACISFQQRIAEASISESLNEKRSHLAIYSFQVPVDKEIAHFARDDTELIALLNT